MTRVSWRAVRALLRNGSGQFRLASNVPAHSVVMLEFVSLYNEMTMNQYWVLPVAAVISLLAPSTLADDSLPVSRIGVDHFDKSALVEPAKIVPCVLENGEHGECVEMTVRYLPDGLDIGPFCQVNLDEPGGLWYWTGDDPALYRVDETFLRKLEGLGLHFFDSDGRLHISNISKAPPAEDNTCIAVTLNSTVEMTVLLPIDPIVADRPANLGTVAKIGLGIDGVPIFADAPTIEQTGHMPSLDTCGGHVDPGGWYHWHAVSTDIETVFEHEHVDADCHLEQEPGALFGYAFDGLPIYGSQESNGDLPSDLDACNGHVGATSDHAGKTYHYHASTSFPNLPPCLVGVQANNNFATTASLGVGASGHPEQAKRPGQGEAEDRMGQGERPRHGPGRMPPGFEEAAGKLGVSSQSLMQAVRDAGGPRLDFAKAAQTLGVSENALRNALPPPPDRPRR